MPPQKKKSGGYKPTALPPLLDLKNKNTRNQLSDPLESRDTVQRQSDAACRDVMKNEVIKWLETDIDGLDLINTRTREGDIKGFWSWLRDFHKEYSDDWFARNMPRLKEQFEPIYKTTLKEQRLKADGVSEDRLLQCPRLVCHSKVMFLIF